MGRWDGFGFINPDRNCEPLADFLGDLDAHYPHRAENPYLGATPFTRQRHELTGNIYDRAAAVAAKRESLRDLLGDKMDQVSDAALLDPIC